jgi:hypothetical protein
MARNPHLYSQFERNKSFVTYSGMTATGICVRTPVKNMASEPDALEKLHGQSGSGLGQDKTGHAKNTRD